MAQLADALTATRHATSLWFSLLSPLVRGGTSGLLSLLRALLRTAGRPLAALSARSRAKLALCLVAGAALLRLRAWVRRTRAVPRALAALGRARAAVVARTVAAVDAVAGLGPHLAFASSAAALLAWFPATSHALATSRPVHWLVTCAVPLIRAYVALHREAAAAAAAAATAATAGGSGSVRESVIVRESVSVSESGSGRIQLRGGGGGGSLSGTGGGADGKEVTAVLAYFVCRAAMLLARQVPFLFTLAERANPAVALRLGPELALVGHVWLQVPHTQWVAGGAEWVARCVSVFLGFDAVSGDDDGALEDWEGGGDVGEIGKRTDHGAAASVGTSSSGSGSGSGSCSGSGASVSRRRGRQRRGRRGSDLLRPRLRGFFSLLEDGWRGVARALTKVGLLDRSRGEVLPSTVSLLTLPCVLLLAGPNILARAAYLTSSVALPAHETMQTLNDGGRKRRNQFLSYWAVHASVEAAWGVTGTVLAGGRVLPNRMSRLACLGSLWLHPAYCRGGEWVVGRLLCTVEGFCTVFAEASLKACGACGAYGNAGGGFCDGKEGGRRDDGVRDDFSDEVCSGGYELVYDGVGHGLHRLRGDVGETPPPCEMGEGGGAGGAKGGGAVEMSEKQSAQVCSLSFEGVRQGVRNLRLLEPS